MAELTKNKVYFQKLHQNIINLQNNSSLSVKFESYLSRIEQELNDLEFHNKSNLEFKEGAIRLNPKLEILEYLLIGFVDVLNMLKLKIRNKDDKILSIKKLFKKKILDLSSSINNILKNIFKNTNRLERRKIINNCFELQNQLNALYEYYETKLKNSNNSAKKIIQNYSNYIKNLL